MDNIGGFPSAGSGDFMRETSALPSNRNPAKVPAPPGVIKKPTAQLKKKGPLRRPSGAVPGPLGKLLRPKPRLVRKPGPQQRPGRIGPAAAKAPLERKKKLHGLTEASDEEGAESDSSAASGGSRGSREQYHSPRYVSSW